MAIGNIFVGTCNWSDHEDFYPKGLPAGDRLAYYARFFDLVEVDSTYYHLQPARNFDKWAGVTPDGFRFDVKAFKQLTKHDREVEPEAGTFEKFSAALQPLRDAGKLQAILFQFPPWFTAREDNEDYLRTLQDFFPGDLLAVEFRHRSWLTGEQRERTLQLLAELAYAFTMVDEPQLGSGTVPKVVAATSPLLSVARFHGRNAQTWYKKTKTTGERFNYLYQPEELAEWLPDIRSVAAQTQEVHVLMNNNASNYAVRNAQDFVQLLGGPAPLQGRQLSLMED